VGSQKVVNNPLGSYPVDVDRDASANTRQAVGIDFGTVTGGVYTASRVSAANPLPVTATFSGANVTVDNGAGAAAVNIQDGGNSITVDGAVTVSGTVSVTEPVSVDDNGGSLTVDGIVAVSSVGGTVAIAGAVTNTVLSVVGGGVEATAQRVTIASDSTGVLSVDDNGGSLTVDGTVAVSSVGGTVAVSAASLPLPTGAATSANQSTEITSLQLIDDLVLAEDAVHSTGAPGVLGLTRRADTASSSAGTDGDYATLNTDGSGRLHTADTRTGTSAQEVQGVQTNAAALTGKIFPTGFIEFFSNTAIVPHCITSGGVNYNLSLNPDLGLGFIDYSPAGEVYSLCAATANSSATARYIAVNSAGEVKIIDKQDSAACTNVAGSATSVSLLASNSSRKKAKFYNDSSAILYLKEGATASSTSFTIKLFPEGFYETEYTGAIDGIWASAVGAVRITEMT
jgi:hypothetical protein